MANNVEIIISAKDVATGAFNKLGKTLRATAKAATISATALTAIGVSLTAIARSTAAAGDRFAKLSDRLGVSAQAMSEFAFVAERSGISFDTFAMALQRQTRRVAEAAQGTGEAKDALKELNLVAKDLNKLAPEDQFTVIAEKLSNLSNESDKVRLAMKLFDSEGVSLVQTMKGGTEGIEALRKKARELGVTFSDIEANQAAAFEDSLTNLTSVFKGIKNTIGKELIPIFTELFNRMAEGIKEILPAVKQFSITFIAILIALPKIAQETINLIKTLFVNFFTDFSFFQAFLKNFSILAVALLQNWGNILIEMGAIVLKLSSIIWIPLGEAFSVVGSNIRFGWQILINNLAELMTKGALSIADNLNKILPEAFEIDTSGLKGVLAEIENEVIKPAKTMEEAFAEGGSTIIGMLDSIGDNAANIGENITGVFDTLKEAGVDLAESPEIQEFFENIQALVAETQEQVVAFGETSATSIKEGLTGGEEGFEGIKTMWDELGEHITENLITIQDIAFETWDSFQQGVGDAVANAIVFGESLGKAFQNLLKQLVASVISSLIQIGIQRLAQALIARAINTQEAQSRLAVLSAETFGGAFASTVAIPIIGPAIAPGVAAASQAAMLAGSVAAGAAGAATGSAIGQADDGIANVPRRGTFVLDTNERVLSANQNKDFTDFMNGNQGGGGQIVVEELNIMPGASITEGLLEQDSSFFLEFAERLLPELNVLGDNGATTTLTKRETNL